ncbi:MULTISPECIES: hypothetical protein [unclassified Lacinutrix]|uniref:hypothetical protein n=1 Tax=unclassified Lacinutrix TaxID=2647285 RepID=UPI00020A3CA7|nr:MULTISPECIES: hypothetical protein [unclassified Lacinutrix]AEH00563.1 hypothetical protein Lacal_0713 [Lacinutrix sp. 5H-3-7-4]OIQ23240.1 MAG: hypothetical protein BM549_04290 [Lacinutrix sp. MedPE-SW]
MRNSILIIATVVFSFLTVNATNLKSQANTVTRVNIHKDEIIEVFDWTVKTTTGEFSGTASSLFDAKRRANIVGQNAIVIEQKITNYFILKSEMQSNNNRVFFWEVNTEKGYAKGFSSNEFNAKKMMHLVAKGDITSYRIIENKKK